MSTATEHCPEDTPRVINHRFREEIATQPGGEDILLCSACGNCTASCPLGRIDARYDPRRVIRMALLGMRERVFQDEFVWECSLHYDCSQRCPQGVDIGAVSRVVRRLAWEAGYRGPDKAAVRTAQALSSERLDLEWKWAIAAHPEAKTLVRCFSCGGCSVNCPEKERDSNCDPRQFIRLIQLGMKEEVFARPFTWVCATHSSCQNRCPQGVNLKAVMHAIKTLALREGYRSPRSTSIPGGVEEEDA